MNKLDLHGVRHHEVQQVVDQFLSKHLYNSTNEVSIIIGNSDKMKKIVDNVLKDYNLKSEYSYLSKAELKVKL
jgi:DNA-nicking Smr family endonuclease|tara:strand:+ start:1253 stop:1471 length:219 start_codon:yes stop_codon:yes gene_type:complete